MDGQQFVQLLQSLLEPNTEVVRKSTAELKKYSLSQRSYHTLANDTVTEITTLTLKP